MGDLLRFVVPRGSLADPGSNPPTDRLRGAVDGVPERLKLRRKVLARGEASFDLVRPEFAGHEVGQPAVLLTGSGATFVENFNRFWDPVTGVTDSHAAVIASATAAGFVEAPADFYWSLIPITWIYLELVFNQSSAYIGGEVKRASRIQLWSMPIAAVISVAVAIVSATDTTRPSSPWSSLGCLALSRWSSTPRTPTSRPWSGSSPSS